MESRLLLACPQRVVQSGHPERFESRARIVDQDIDTRTSVSDGGGQFAHLPLDREIRPELQYRNADFKYEIDGGRRIV
jgi:hypothetical protein